MTMHGRSRMTIERGAGGGSKGNVAGYFNARVHRQEG